MDVNQWRQLRVSFAKILFAWQHPTVLSDSVDGDFEEYRERQIFHYFNTDPLAGHVLQALVHAAVNALRESPSGNVRKPQKLGVVEALRASDLTAQTVGREDIEYGHHESLPRGEHVARIKNE